MIVCIALSSKRICLIGSRGSSPRDVPPTIDEGEA